MRADWKNFVFDNLSSTQDVAKSYLAEGFPLPFAVRADMQTAGRGRSGNQWTSLSGNLFVSMCVDIGAVPVQKGGQYSFLAAVALMDTLSEFGVIDARNKWPNDILVGGKKIAGILLEADTKPDGLIHAIIIGVGVNLATAPDSAVSVAEITKSTITPSDFLDALIDKIQDRLDMISVHGFSSIRDAWLVNAYGVGQKMRVRLPNETFYGEFLGLDNDGALLVQEEEKKSPRVIHSGEVFFDI